MAKHSALRVFLVMAVLLCGACATTSVNQTVEGLGPVGDRLLVKREKVTLTSNPWSGASLRYEPAEFFLCGAVAGTSNLQCEPATVQLPEPEHK